MSWIKDLLLTGMILLLGAPGIRAQQDASSVTMDDLYQMLQAQQKLIESQGKALAALSARMDEMAQRQPQVVGETGAAPSGDLVSLQERMAALEKMEQSRTEMPANVLTAGEFPGSIRIPGTNMAGKVGGNVRLGVVNNFDPIGSEDRFIVGSIPVPPGGSSDGEALFEGVNISAKRSRLNLDMRMDSSVGQFRAFVEGDFVTEVDSSDVYRLRHAYGQYRRLIVGQTWSTLMDLAAEPEELDFEGLNGEVVQRRPILRWSRGLGSKRLFSVAIEDPSPDIANGASKSDVPDLVSTIHVQRDTGHIQLGGVLRDLKGEQALDPDGEETRTDSTLGWGLSFSGSHFLQKAQKKDKLIWQLNYGEGLGHYINDTAAIGGQDAVFSPGGSLEALPVFGGYVAYQHFWHRDPLSYLAGKSLLRNLRSTLVYGYTSVNNVDFQPDDAYAETQRASLNLIWSPLAPIDVGVEYLWGSRRNKDGSRGTANQFQIVATFNF